ncbi:MAG TPA: DUF3140 domain-containing protein [Nocardioidaceae bacterium]|nr:DUF3140 domain-containing protein [Nocardioidaceae bacterium]
MANSNVSEDLWDEFHVVVNMTSRELDEFLRADAAGEDSEQLPDQAGSPTGQQVLHILGKRRSDVTDADIGVMEAVVGTIRAERGDEPEPTAGDAAWRHRLMSLGHDPLRPT